MLDPQALQLRVGVDVGGGAVRSIRSGYWAHLELDQICPQLEE